MRLTRPAPDRGPSSPRPSTVRALRNRNFRIYIAGQSVSQVGNWFQQTAEIWLILLITGSATAVGVHTALKFGPLLLFGIPAGLLSDRLDRRTLMIATQTGYTLAIAIIAIASFVGTPSLLLIYAVVFARGILNAIDNPLRRTFVRDLVSDDDLTNAVSLNATMHTIARFIGPALAGALIVAVGVPWCFALNAASYGVVLVSLFRIDRRGMRPAQRAAAAGAAQLAEGLRYAWGNRRIRRTLAMVAILGLFALNWDVVLPLYATGEFGGDARLYGFFLSTMGIGSFAGAVVVMRLTRIAGSYFRWAAALMAGAFVIVALTPVMPAAFLGLAFLGAASTSFQIFAQSRLQLEAEDRLSGRVLALYSVALVGMKPVGGLITGLIVDAAGPRTAFGVSAAIVGALVVVLLLTRLPRAAEAEEGTSAPPERPVTDAEDVIAGDGLGDDEGPTDTRERARPRPADGGG